MRIYSICAVAVLAVALAQASLMAGPIVDYFDTSGTGDLHSQTSTANNSGWAGTGYVSGSNTVDAISGSLSFTNANYTDAVSGNKVQASNPDRSGGRKIGSFITGEVWMSYLVNLYNSSGSNTEVGLREGTGTGNEDWPGYGTGVDGVSYTWNTGTFQYDSGAAALSEDVTYLAVVRFDLSAGGSSLTAWHFAAGDAIPTTEAGLDALSANKLTKSGLSYLTTGSANYVVYHGDSLHADSIRLSTEAGDNGLTEVLTGAAVPEPGSVTLLAGGGLVLLLRRRRR